MIPTPDRPRSPPRGSGSLSLLSPAVLVWNTVRMGEIVARLRAAGEAVSEEDLVRIFPPAYAHGIPNGTYGFDRLQQSQPLPPLGGWDGSALTASSRQALNNSGAASPVCSAARWRADQVALSSRRGRRRPMGRPVKPRAARPATTTGNHACTARPRMARLVRALPNRSAARSIKSESRLKFTTTVPASAGSGSVSSTIPLGAIVAVVVLFIVMATF